MSGFLEGGMKVGWRSIRSERGFGSEVEKYLE